MTKKIKKLEKETTMYRSRWESSNKALLDMVEEVNMTCSGARTRMFILNLNTKQWYLICIQLINFCVSILGVFKQYFPNPQLELETKWRLLCHLWKQAARPSDWRSPELFGSSTELWFPVAGVGHSALLCCFNTTCFYGWPLTSELHDGHTMIIAKCTSIPPASSHPEMELLFTLLDFIQLPKTILASHVAHRILVLEDSRKAKIIDFLCKMEIINDTKSQWEGLFTYNTVESSYTWVHQPMYR